MIAKHLKNNCRLRSIGLICLLILFGLGDVNAQEKQREDELKKERTIRGNRFKVFNNYVNYSGVFYISLFLNNDDFCYKD